MACRIIPVTSLLCWLEHDAGPDYSMPGTQVCASFHTKKPDENSGLGRGRWGSGWLSCAVLPCLAMQVLHQQPPGLAKPPGNSGLSAKYPCGMMPAALEISCQMTGASPPSYLSGRARHWASAVTPQACSTRPRGIAALSEAQRGSGKNGNNKKNKARRNRSSTSGAGYERTLPCC